ncbi:MAG: AI-2E family transporter [Proteobacteria bacterium]|nr:MAG: AI-2E family transporter [Pseudomonadota bacterium]
MLADLPTAPWFRRVLVAGLLLGLLLLTFSVLQPFIVPLIWGGILAYVCWPLHQRMVRGCGGRAGIAALATTLLATIAIVGPLLWLILMVRVEALNAYQTVLAFLKSDPELAPELRELPGVGPWLEATIQELANDPGALNQQIRQLAEESSDELRRVIGGVGRNVVKLFMAVFSMFFLLRDGPRVLKQASAILEGIIGPQVRDYIDAAAKTTQAVVYALILGAIAQGAVAGIGYWLFGVQAPVLLGALTAAIALIPFGAPVVWLSLAVWMMLTGELWAGVGLFAWGVLLVSWVDNLVRPLVISGATRMPFLLVVFGVLGGVLAFGLVGLFVGPVLLAVSLAIWREWLQHHQVTAEGPQPSEQREPESKS